MALLINNMSYKLHPTVNNMVIRSFRRESGITVLLAFVVCLILSVYKILTLIMKVAYDQTFFVAIDNIHEILRRL